MNSASWQCACCGPADAPTVRGLPNAPTSPLASLCDYCASGSCDACNGVTSGAPFAGSGYVEVPTSPCEHCQGLGTLPMPYYPGDPVEEPCPRCTALGYTSDPAHGLTSLSLAWCDYLTQLPTNR